MFTITVVILSILSLTTPSSSSDQPPRSPTDVCIIGTGIAGSSVAHFLRQYSSSISQIRMFERHPIVGGRMATVTIGGETFEAGASILHPKNYHALNFTHLLNLKVKGPSASDSSFSLGIWDGQKFLFKTIDSKPETFATIVVYHLLPPLNQAHLYRFLLHCEPHHHRFNIFHLHLPCFTENHNRSHNFRSH